jgi:hypothetical protein
VYVSAPLKHACGIADSTTPTRRSKPAGVVGCLLYRSVGTVPATDPSQIAFNGMFTRTPADLPDFDSSDVGKVASYVARWTNAKGEEGPWSDIVTKTVTN